jgi:hypothetical protein
MFPLAGGAQRASAITPAERSAAIKNIEAALQKSYIYPKKAAAMTAMLERNTASHAYDGLEDGRAFAERLTNDLESVSRDQHLFVEYAPEVHPVDPPLVTPAILEPPPQVAYPRIEKMFVNDGFVKAEILPGNIGYLRVDVLLPRELMEKVAPAAFRFVANTKALILDFRKNGGALGPSSMPTFSGYFFEHRTQFDTIYWRHAQPSRDYSAQSVAGPRYTGRPVYILTSGHTASGAEGFAYAMKAFKRATIVGTPTMGAANPGAALGVSPHLSIFVPIGRVENTVTKSNWDYSGVAPDVRVDAIGALNMAQTLELRRQLSEAHNGGEQTVLRTALEELQGLNRLESTVMLHLDGYRGARRIFAAGTFNFNSETDTPMRRTAGGWAAAVKLPPGRYTYHFIVDGVAIGGADHVLYVK